MPWHAVFAFLNPLLVGVLQVKCQSQSASPFDTHRSDMWTFLLATLVYCFAFAANTRRRRYAVISGHVALISGSLSSVSLVSVLLPRSLGRLIFFTWIILPVVVSRQTISCICRWISKSIFRLYLGVVNRFNMIKCGNTNTEQPQTLPV
ncbi:hypothetical protein TorRG33x02_212480 [Trema orientale]|uniref:Transmembrane protein n=1 Tax=Trema orientale TaxID=63057 RepID=A0A2P5EBN6_TREOI|nr:hypothetical protein TorRG33x02_212480 [Trema orientale]